MEGKLGGDYRVAVIGKSELALGSRLAGVVDTYDTEEGAEAERIIRELMQRADIGLIVISSRIVKEIKDRKILNAIDSSIMPLFMEIPGYKEEKVPDTLRRLIIRAIGIDISNKNASG